MKIDVAKVNKLIKEKGPIPWGTYCKAFVIKEMRDNGPRYPSYFDGRNWYTMIDVIDFAMSMRRKGYDIILDTEGFPIDN